jgi:hypothetical protein
MSFVPVGNHLSGFDSDPRNYIANLEQVIGRIPDHVKYDFMQNQSRTFGDLTELLLSRATPVITQQVTGLLEKAYVSPYTQFLLPIRQLGPYESINVKWTEVNFNPGLAPQVEMLGVGRYFTHNKTRRGARAVRRGAAVKIESGFFMTPEGRDEWRLQIEQLVTVIQNTNEYDVLLTLLQSPMRKDRHANQMNGPYNHVYGVNYDLTFEQRFELERDMAFIINKTPDSRGFNSLVTNLRNVMARNDVMPDAMIVPPYLLGYYFTTNDDLWHHSSAGPAAAANREMAADIGGGSAFRSQTIQGLRLVDTYIYRAVKGARESVCDLLTSPWQIGEYYPLEIDMVHRDKKSYQKYTSKDRDARIFNEDISRIAPVYFMDAVKNSHRFDLKDDGMPKDDGPLIENEAGVNQDMFSCNAGDETTKVWGDMEIGYLSIDTIKKVVITMMNSFSDKEQDEANASLAIVGKPTLDNKYITRLLKMVPLTGRAALVPGTIKAADYHIQYTRSDISKTKNAVPAHGAHTDLFGDDSSKFEQIATALFLSGKINLTNIQAMHDTDVFIPVDAILTRPWMTYNMSSVVIMKAGKETGETIIGQQDFQMSSNTQDRTLEASHMYYGKAIVKKSRNVVVAPRVFCQSYVSGNNLKYISKKTLEEEIQNRSGVFESDESIFSMLIPVGGKVHENNWIDVRGSNANVSGKEFHRSKEFYTNMLRLDDLELATPTEEFIDYEDMTFAANTLCWLGHIEYGPGAAFVNFNMGHLGPNTYDQCNHSRKEGIFSPVRPLNCNARTVQ